MLGFGWFFSKATPGFEPGVKVLQTLALPLGYVAAPTITYDSTIFLNLHYLGEIFLIMLLIMNFFHRLDRLKACPVLDFKDLIGLLGQNSPTAGSKKDQRPNPKYAHLFQDFALCRG